MRLLKICCFEAIDARGGRSILAGGTGLYVRAAVDDYDFPQGDQTENPVRERWTTFAEENGAMALWEELRACDPESAAELHPHNVRRVVRAFELLDAGTTYAAQRRNLATLGQAVPACFFGLAVDPANLVLSLIHISYIKRLEKLEEIANSYKGVERTYAIQAGREVRVMVEPEIVDEAATTVLAHDIAHRIESEMQYPGQVKVVVIRESRAVGIAK